MVQAENFLLKVKDKSPLAGPIGSRSSVFFPSELLSEEISVAREVDKRVAYVCLFYAVLASAVWLVQGLADPGKPLLLAIVAGVFSAHLLVIRRSLADPSIVFALTMFVYSFLPLIADTDTLGETLGFDLSQAYPLYNVGQISTMLAIAIAAFAIPQVAPSEARLDEEGRAAVMMACVVGGLVSGVLGIILISLKIALKGFVLGGDISYGQSFTLQLEAGMGVYLLSVPLAITSMALLLVSRHPASKFLLIVPLVCYFEILIGIGQRKYFIQPALFMVAFYWRARYTYEIMLVVVGVVAMFILFCFLGYLRINGVEIKNIINPSLWSDFLNNFGQYSGSETVYLYGTAAAAVQRVVVALPYGGDYLLSWVSSVPHIFLSADAEHSLYVSANDRFAQAYNPEGSVNGAGYGFAFVGEAYLVGGLPMIFFVVTMQVLALRYLYVRGGGERQVGLFGALSLTSVYFSLWTQRNAFAYTLKEFIVDSAFIVVTLYVLGRSLSLGVLPIFNKLRIEKQAIQKALPLE